MNPKKTWRKFNFKEWRSDEDLRRVSREARSFWLDLCGLIYEAGDQGRLSLKGRPYTVQDLADVLGDDPRVIRRLLAELQAAGVFDTSTDNFITSRRILREEVAADFYQKSGRSGGNPALKNKEFRDQPLKPKNQIKEQEPEKEKNSEEAKASSAAAPPAVSHWELCVHAICAQTGKTPATERGYLGLLRKDLAGFGGEDALREIITDALSRDRIDLKGWLRDAVNRRKAAARANPARPTVALCRLGEFRWCHDWSTGENFTTEGDRRIPIGRNLTDAESAEVVRAVDAAQTMRRAA